MTIPSLNSGILDCVMDIFLCNLRQLFTDFVNFLITSSKVTFARLFLSCGTLTLTLALENEQARAQIQLKYVLYIQLSLTNLINSHKLNVI